MVPPQACNQLSKAVGSKDVEDVCLETGHIGIYVSSKFQKLFAPKIVQWLKERDKEEIVTQTKLSDVRKKSAKNGVSKVKRVRHADDSRAGSTLNSSTLRER